MRLQRLWLAGFRNHGEVEVALPPGLTVLQGPNGAGKTNILEAIGYLATLSSFRGAGSDALVAQGRDTAVVRGKVTRGDRELLIEVELRRHGRGRVSLNRQPVRRSADLAEGLAVSVFSPDDLELVKGGPAARRRWLDDVVVALHPRNAMLRHDLDRVVRQRNALLAQVRGRLTPEVAATLDVWDAKLVATGESLAAERVSALQRLEPFVRKAYEHLAVAAGDDPATSRAEVTLSYEASWRERGLGPSLADAREAELRRGVSLVGPHRDDVGLLLGGLSARTCASQGEQRSLALALRLAAHQLLTDAWGEAPVLLLDDVFSELDAGRSSALVEHLPPGQALLTTTGGSTPGMRAEQVFVVSPGSAAPAATAREERL